MNEIHILFDGFEHLVAGIITPFCVALAASIVRVALWGWHGFRHFLAIFVVAFVLGMGAHWIMLDMDIGGNTRTAITLGVAMISKDFLYAIFSRRVFSALQRRIIHDITHRGRRLPMPEETPPFPGERP